MTELTCTHLWQPQLGEFIEQRYRRILWFGAPSLTKITLPSDEALAVKVSQDPTAFGELYERYINRIYAYHLLHTSNVLEAQDLTSQTFMAALENIHTYRQEGKFSAWLLGIAQRKLADYYRHRKDDLPLETTIDIQPDCPSVEHSVEQHLLLQTINQELQNMVPERAEALILRVFSQFSVTEIADIMQKSENAVRMLVYRAQMDLRQQLFHQTTEEK